MTDLESDKLRIGSAHDPLERLLEENGIAHDLRGIVGGIREDARNIRGMGYGVRLFKTTIKKRLSTLGITDPSTVQNIMDLV